MRTVGFKMSEEERNGEDDISDLNCIGNKIWEPPAFIYELEVPHRKELASYEPGRMMCCRFKTR